MKVELTPTNSTSIGGSLAARSRGVCSEIQPHHEQESSQSGYDGEVLGGNDNLRPMNCDGFFRTIKRSCSAPLMGALSDSECLLACNPYELEGPFSSSNINARAKESDASARNPEQPVRSGSGLAAGTISREIGQHSAETSLAAASSRQSQPRVSTEREPFPRASRANFSRHNVLSEEARLWLGDRSVGQNSLETVRAEHWEGDMPSVGSTGASYQERAYVAFVGAVAQMLGAGATFGLKPFLEAATEKALIEAGIDEGATEGDVLPSKLLSNVIGGLVVGAFHSALGSSVADYANSKMGGVKFTDQTESITQKELNDVVTTTLPVCLAFIGSFSAGPALVARAAPQVGQDAWMAAVARSLQSFAGGFVQGLITTTAKGALGSTTKSEKQQITLGGMWKQFGETLAKQFNYKHSPEFMKNTVGKIVGGTLGMAAATYAGHEFEKALGASSPNSMIARDAGIQAASGAVSMTAFLALWFTCIHVGSLLGQSMDRSSSLPRPAANEADTTRFYNVPFSKMEG